MIKYFSFLFSRSRAPASRATRDRQGREVARLRVRADSAAVEMAGLRVAAQHSDAESR